MRERPILFSAPMVRAILEGRKTQTRRAVKPQPYIANTAADGMRFWNVSGAVGGRIMLEPDFFARCPYGQPGDRLWVRETFSGPHCMEAGEGCCAVPPSKWGESSRIWYWADGNPSSGDWTRPRPSIHMPRWASRITLEITGVRVERLQEISESHAIAEGISRIVIGDGYDPKFSAESHSWADAVEQHPGAQATARHAYRDLWESINGDGSWAANPWVWVISFRRVTP